MGQYCKAGSYYLDLDYQKDNNLYKTVLNLQEAKKLWNLQNITAYCEAIKTWHIN